MNFFDLFAGRCCADDLFTCREEAADTGRDADKVQYLKRALSGLNKRDRLIVQYRSEGLSYWEISELAGMRVQSAITAHSRAVRKLKKLFYEELKEE